MVFVTLAKTTPVPLAALASWRPDARLHGLGRSSRWRQILLALALAVPLNAVAKDRLSVAPKNMQAVAPGLAGYTDDVLFGDVWERGELTPRDRSIVTVTVLIATGKTAQLPGHLERGLANGIKPDEIAGIVTHLAFYSGWPNAVSALNVIEPVFTSKFGAGASLPTPVDSARPNGARTTLPTIDPQIAGAAPKLAQLSKDVLYADLWRRTDLSRRDRSLVTIVALAANGDLDGLADQVREGIANGLTRTEIGEALTHMAFYAGWPKATAAVAVASKLLDEGATQAPNLRLVPPGEMPVAAPATNFTGQAVVTSPFKGSGGARLGGATVTFQPGAHTNWHSHPLGQLLIVTAGTGWVQVEGEPARLIKAGDTVWTAPNVKHWHGATKSQSMAHVAVAETLAGKSVDWREPVSSEQYESLHDGR